MRTRSSAEGFVRSFALILPPFCHATHVHIEWWGSCALHAVSNSHYYDMNRAAAAICRPQWTERERDREGGRKRGREGQRVKGGFFCKWLLCYWLSEWQDHHPPPLPYIHTHPPSSPCWICINAASLPTGQMSSRPTGHLLACRHTLHRF